MMRGEDPADALTGDRQGRRSERADAGEPPLSEEEAIAILERMAARAVPGPPPGPPPAVLPLPPKQPSPPLWSALSFHDLVDALPDAVVVINETGTIVLINHQTEALFGYARDELLGQAIEILVPERFRGDHIDKRRGFFAQPESRAMGARLELVGRHRDGSEIPVEISLSPLSTPLGLVVTSIIRDVRARKRQEAKFRTLVENIPAVTFIAPLDRSAPELYVSPQIEQLLGFSAEEWLNNPILWFQQLHPDDQNRWNRQFSPTCSEGTPFRSEYRFISKDGRVVWVQGMANVVSDTEGKLLFLQGVAFDITGIKEAEEERDRFFAVGLDLFCVAGFDGYFHRVNAAFTRVLGYSTEELLECPFLGLVHPDDREATQEQLDRLAHGQVSDRFENRYRCADDSYRWLQWAAVPYPDKHLIYAAARDVTREKADELALREQARLAELRANVSAICTRGEHLPDLLNRCAARVAQHFDGVVRIWIGEGDPPTLLLQAAAGPQCEMLGNGAVDEETVKARVASTRQPLCTEQAAAYPLLIEGRLLGVLAVFSQQPLSSPECQAIGLLADKIALGIKRKQSEEALLRANAELDRRVQERTKALERAMAELQARACELQGFAVAAHHDVGGLVRTIRMSAQTVERDTQGKLTGKAPQKLHTVISATERGEQLIEKLLDYADFTGSEKMERVDCGQIAILAQQPLQTEIDAIGAEINIGELPVVDGVAIHLERLLRNLISNAIKYRDQPKKGEIRTPRPLRVEIGAERYEGGWKFWVRDNGLGIEARHIEGILKKPLGQERRLHSKREIPGWGYGLATCQKTVASRGGNLWIESEYGKGSTFYFTVPDLPPESAWSE